MRSPTPEGVAAWATATGVGLVALMICWLVGQRLVAVLWRPPTGPIVALTAATVTAVIVTVLVGRRLAASRNP